MSDDAQNIDSATRIVVAFLASNPISPAELPELVRSVRAALESTPGKRPNGGRSETAQDAEPNGHNGLSTSVLDDDQAEIVDGMMKIAAPNVAELLKPAVDPKESVHHKYICCLEDGLTFKSMKRHLSAAHGLSPEEYREKWDLPADYPMVAPAYSAKRSMIMKGNHHRSIRK